MHCTAERVKGKRVQIPHDLVTVKGVRIRVLCTSHWSFCSGKEMTGGDLSVRKPACCWYGGANPRSRGIGCTKKP